VVPAAISLMERTEHGTITMPMVGKEPDEIEAPISAVAWKCEASARTSLGFMSVS
jgi:hypothetical protein